MKNIMKSILFLMIIMIPAEGKTGEYIHDYIEDNRPIKPARTGVTNSVHDMNVYFGGTPDEFGRVCIFCHTPHNAQRDPLAPDENLPLWNHEFSSQNWEPYIWAVPENELLPIVDPLDGPSRLCMSCHDGVVAIDQHGPAQAFAGTTVLTGNRAIGRQGDLTDDHPIGFDYREAFTRRNFRSDGASLPIGELVEIDQFFATEIVPSNVAGIYDHVVRSGTRTIEEVLYRGAIMTCSSCHEVHNRDNAIQDPGLNGYTPNYLLHAKEKDSLICLSCHIK